MKKLSQIFFLLLFSYHSQAQIDSVLISNVKFNDAKYDNAHDGSGFLLKYKSKVYAVTAKHVLFFAKTDSMKSISFGGDLKSWDFTSKSNTNTKVKAGKLINEDPNEILVMPPKGDWLIFEIKGDIPENVAVYKLRKKPLKIGEAVHFLGYPYKSEKHITVHGNLKGFTEDNNLSLAVPKGTYNGCSGGPVLDSKGKVVGLVSMGYFDNKTDQMVFEPASLEYFKQIINN